MTGDHERPLRQVVRSIARGRPLDWREVSRQLGERPAALEGLRTLHQIATFCRVERSAIHEATSRSGALLDVPVSIRSGVDGFYPASDGTWGHLRLVERIGQGSSGEVFRAYDPDLQIDVALKLWFPRWSSSFSEDQFLSEARSLARIRHPNILTVFGVAGHDGRVGMWSELLSGETLEECLASRGLYGAIEAALIGVEVCGALAAVHAAGLVHRDVKPRNVMRAAGGRIVVMDFGSATRLNQPDSRECDSFLVGTPLSMAPEQLLGGPIGSSVDLYALGVLLYRILTGRYPVEASTLEELEGRHRRAEHTPLRDVRPDLPVDLIRAVERNLSHNPSDRFPSAGAFERALLDFVANRRRAEQGRRQPDGDRTHPAPAGTKGLQATPSTSFVGRRREIAECTRLLAENRVLSLVGPGGCGKTRLAVQSAEVWANETGRGAWFVDLSPLGEDARVPHAIAATLGVRVRPRSAVVAALLDHLRPQQCLIVLDNCEHVRRGCAAVLAKILNGCPSVTILATSREALNLPGERTYLVPPLSYPPSTPRVDRTALMEYEAVQLFLDRAARVCPSFCVNEQNAAAVSEICRRVDGIPLAVELIAARTRAITPEEIRRHLDQALRLATTTQTGVEPKQRAMAATIELSYDRLDGEERSFFESLSVFRSGWNLESATAVCTGVVDELQVADVITRLIDRSLVAPIPPIGGQSRFRFLEVVRQFAANRLANSGREASVKDAFLAYFLALAEVAQGMLWGPAQATWLRRLEAEHDNLLASLDWSCRGSGRIERGLQLAGSLFRFWYTRGYFEIGRRMLDRVLSHPDAQSPSAARCRALFGAAGMAVYRGDYGTARRMYTDGLQYHLGVGDRKNAGRWMIGLGLVEVEGGNFDVAEALHQEALECYQDDSDRPAVPIILHNLSQIALCRGDMGLAWRRANEGLALARETDNKIAQVSIQANLAGIAVREARIEPARDHLVEALQLVKDLDLRQGGLETLESAGALAIELGQAQSGLRLLGAAEALRDTWHVPFGRAERSTRKALVTAAARSLGRTVFEACRTKGRHLSFEEAIDEALEWLGQGARPRSLVDPRAAKQ